MTNESASKTNRGRGRPRVGDSAPNGEQIIEAAVRAVRRLGPGVTMDDIAAEAGVTKPIIYREIGDKSAVAEAVAEYTSLQIEERTRRVLTASITGAERFRLATRMFFESMWDDRQLLSFVEYGWGSTDGRQLEVMIERAAAPLMRADAGLFGDRPSSEASRRTWAYATIGALRTVVVMWVRDDYCQIDQLVDDVVEFVVRPADG